MVQRSHHQSQPGHNQGACMHRDLALCYDYTTAAKTLIFPKHTFTCRVATMSIAPLLYLATGHQQGHTTSKLGHPCPAACNQLTPWALEPEVRLTFDALYFNIPFFTTSAWADSCSAIPPPNKDWIPGYRTAESRAHVRQIAVFLFFEPLNAST